MENILVVEEDPVVWLDLGDLLRLRFAGAIVERLSLAEAMDALRDGVRAGQALITATLPQNVADLAACCGAGLRLLVTNAGDAAAHSALPHAVFFERPFDANELVAKLDGAGKADTISA
jgi:hypothetical protein